MDITALFEKIESDVLTEQVKLEISTLFEAAVNEAISQKEVALEEQNRAEITEFKESMTEQIDEYLNYFVEEFIKENDDLVDSKVKVKTASKILETFSKIVNDFNLELSEESENQNEEIESLKEDVNKLTNKLIESKKEIENVTKAAMIAEAAAKFETDVQKDKFIEIVSKLEFDKEMFESKLVVIRDQIIAESKSVETPPKLEEANEPEVIVESQKTDLMKSYLKYL